MVIEIALVLLAGIVLAVALTIDPSPPGEHPAHPPDVVEPPLVFDDELGGYPKRAAS